MYVLVTYKNEDQMKNEGARVVTTVYSYTTDARGQLTMYLVIMFCYKSNSFKLLRLSKLSARMRLILFKKEDTFKSGHSISFIVNLCQFFKNLRGSLLHSLRLVLLEIQTHPSSYGCPC